MKWFWILSFLLASTLSHHSMGAEVKLAETEDGFQLLVDQKPFAVKGAGGDGDLRLLAEAGANAVRTWGIGSDTQARLDEAHQHGLKVALGIWLGHARHGFNYDDPAQVAKQLADAKTAVMKYKDHPAVLLWGVGNEMEGFEESTDPKVWQAVNDIARMIAEVDPNHPTMTVIAEIGGDKLPSIAKYCPDVDIVGINSYGGVTSIPQRFAQAKLDKPYLVTEFGPPGTWETPNNDWDVPLELTSTEKAKIYRDAYQKLAADPKCLGSFAFTWGFKQEATATWFGMFLPDGTKVASVDAMTEAWSGKPPKNLCPRIESLEVVGEPIAEPNKPIEARLKVVDPEGKRPQVKWVLFREMEEFNTMGDYRPAPPTFPEAITDASLSGVTVKMPQLPGNYRLFAYAYDGDGGGAVANVPLKVAGEVSMQHLAQGRKVPVPFTVYADEMNGSPFTPAGYMGETAAIAMDQASTTQPHSGKTCLKVTYDKPDGWGGVVWQSPANDWGDRPGGFDLSDADTLEIWARGHSGGERVKLGFGLIDRDKPFYDTAKGEIEVMLTQQWQSYKIPLVQHNAGRIKTGFYWTLAGQGKPVTFYLDDIRYTKGEE